MQTVLRFVLAAGLGFVVYVPESAHAEDASPTWSIGLGGGIASPYDYLDYSLIIGGIVVDYSGSFGRTWMASLAVSHRVGRSTWLQTGVDYFNQEDPGYNLSVRMACSSLGVRYQFDPDQRAHPYVELLPAVFIGRWTDETTQKPTTSLRPGITGGFGLMGPLGGRFAMEVGLKGYLSSGWPSVGHIGPGQSDFEGVKRWTLGGKVLYGF